MTAPGTPANDMDLTTMQPIERYISKNTGYKPMTFQPISAVMAISVATSPGDSYDLITSYIRQAQEEIYVYIYEFSSADLLQELLARVEAGVKLNLMYDAPGGSHPANTAYTDMLKSPTFQAIQAKAAVSTAPSKADRRCFGVCHQKYMVVDGKAVVVESGNWTASSMYVPHPARPQVSTNREWYITVENPDLAQAFIQVFKQDRDWQPPPGREIAPPEAPVEIVERAVGLQALKPKLFPHESFNPQMTTLRPVCSPDNYLSTVLAEIQASTKSIRLQQQYLKAEANPEDTQAVPEILAALKAARERGLEIRLMIPNQFASQFTASMNSIKRYGLDDCVKVCDPKLIFYLHNKGIVFDDDRVLVSSTNGNEQSINNNREAGVLIKHRDVAAYFTQIYDYDWDNGIPASEAPVGTREIEGPFDTMEIDLD